MTLALLRQLHHVREGKLAQAEREHFARLAEAARARTLHEATEAEHRATVEAKRALQAQWRAQRLARDTFVQDDCLAQDAALGQWDRRIAASRAAMDEAAVQLTQALQAVQQARDALARSRVDLAKAERAVEREREQLARRDEAREEDELDELAILGRGAARAPLHTEAA